jgi:hypothetical protein
MPGLSGMEILIILIFLIHIYGLCFMLWVDMHYGTGELSPPPHLGIAILIFNLPGLDFKKKVFHRRAVFISYQ